MPIFSQQTTIHQCNKRLLWVDALNIIACIGVVIMHCTNNPVHHYPGLVDLDFMRGAFTHSFFLWPVPVFYALSGCMLISKNYSTKEIIRKYIKKRFIRTFVPFIFWASFYVISPLIIKHENVSVFYTIGRILSGPGVLWFFIPLFGLYIMYPFISRMIKNASSEFIITFLIFSFVFNCFIPFIGKISDLKYLIEFIDKRNLFVLGSGFVMYAVCGYYIGHYQIRYKYRFIIYFLSLIATLAQFLIILIRIPSMGYDDGIFTHTGTPTNILTVLGVLLWFRYTDWNKALNFLHITPSVLTHISACSLGVYLIHMFIIGIYNHFFPGFIAHTPCSFLIIYLMSLFITFIVRRLPVIKYIMP